jgi:pimeloyl-ACP methyl ester carboxylesterase
LSNGLVTARVDAMGLLVELIVDGMRLALEPGAGSLVLYPDRAASFESWDIDRQALDLGVTVETPVEVGIERDQGGLRGALCIRRAIGRSSSVIQRYVLESGSRVLRIELELDWHEAETLLKLHLKTGYRGTRVRCGAPFGSILRPQQPGPLAAEAMWEVPASRWIAGADDGGGHGMFIVTESKYGFSCRDGDWGVSLVRSPRMTGFESHRGAYPAGISRLRSVSPYSDQGTHIISLAVGRYDPTGARENHPAWLADTLFTKPIPYVGRPIEPVLRALTGGDTLIPCWAKPLGREDWVLRLHEVGGERGRLHLELADGWTAQKVDLCERPRDAPLSDGRLEFKPYEIVSVHIHRAVATASRGDTDGTVRQSSWHGFYREDFEVSGRAAILVRPVASLPSKPWIWRTEFFGAFDSVDRALLQAGFHLAYVDVQNMYGSPASMVHMDRFYSQLRQRYGLGARPVLEGFSRGGLFALNWAARDPRAVSCLYLDAPVCDFKSWPAGLGRAAGSRQDWLQLQNAYGFTEAQALAYTGNPIDNLAPVARAGVPIIAVYGETDVDLPPAENILLLRERYVELGGEIALLAKPGVGHHPHSLPDPTPILEFILPRAL